MSAECIIQYMYLCDGNSGGGGESGRGNGIVTATSRLVGKVSSVDVH